MSYDSVEAGLQGVITNVSGLSTSNVTLGDYRALGHGHTRVAVLRPGPFDRRVTAAPRRMGTTWITIVDIFVPFDGELSTVADDVRVYRQEIIDEVDKYPLLNGTSGVINAIVSGGGEPTLWQGENRRWWMQSLTVEIEERATITIAEA